MYVKDVAIENLMLAHVTARSTCQRKQHVIQLTIGIAPFS